MTEPIAQNPHARSFKRNSREMMARLGLSLPRVALRNVGIRIDAAITIEYQQTAKRYVLRAVESGGAINELGAYCSFVGEDGQPLGWTQKVDKIGVNGVHAVVIAPTLTRVEVSRVEHTYDLLITRHSLRSKEGERRPTLANEIIFYGQLGQLPLDLWSRDRTLRGSVSPAFLSRSGEPVALPEAFEKAINEAVAGACCVGCRRHTHVLVAPAPSAVNDKGSAAA